MDTDRTETTTQNGLAQKKFFNNPEFAARYKLGEPITGAFALELLKQLDLDQQREAVHFLDLACGTGIVSKHAIDLLNQARSSSRLSFKDRFTCSDMAPMMLEILRSRIGLEAWPIEERHVEITQGDMRDNTKLPDDTYTHIACNFGPVMASHPEKVLQECFRMTRPGGVSGWTAWVKLGWMPDVNRAIKDIREEATRKCYDGTASANDCKLSQIPDIQPAEEIIGRFAGLDIRSLRADGIEEKDLPRWDDADFFRRQVAQAGFTDVKVNTVQKTFHIDYDTATQMTKPVVDILAAFWTQEQREVLADVQLEDKVTEWWVRRFHESDVVDGKISWDQSEALVVSGRKVIKTTYIE